MLGLPINALPITFIICGVMILLFTLPLILGLPKRDVVVSYLMQVLVHGSMALQQEAQPIFRGK
jgi:MFS-type transporter involved in bile tolerance (Atg22 family)